LKDLIFWAIIQIKLSTRVWDWVSEPVDRRLHTVLFQELVLIFQFIHVVFNDDVFWVLQTLALIWLHDVYVFLLLCFEVKDLIFEHLQWNFRLIWIWIYYLFNLEIECVIYIILDSFKVELVFQRKIPSHFFRYVLLNYIQNWVVESVWKRQLMLLHFFRQYHFISLFNIQNENSLHQVDVFERNLDVPRLTISRKSF